MSETETGVCLGHVRGTVSANFGVKDTSKGNVCEAVVQAPDGSGGFYEVRVSGWDARAKELVETAKKGTRVQITGGLVNSEWEKDGEEGKTNRRIQLILSNDDHSVAAADAGDDMNSANIAGLVTFAGEVGEMNWEKNGEKKKLSKQFLFVQTPVKAHDGSIKKPSVPVEILGKATELGIKKGDRIELTGEIRNIVLEDPKTHIGVIQVTGPDPQIKIVEAAQAA